jgi:hypothetical protein
MQIKYASKKFRAERLQMIDAANDICEEYAARGLSVTLRQLYYRFVARNLFANDDRNYNRLGEAISEARLAGMFDWDYIIDRTRNLKERPDWKSPEDLIDQAADQYLTDLWAPQKKRIEVWIEKDAAIGVIEAVSRANHVPYFSCRGYVSQSEMWEAGTRIGEYLRNGEQVRILHIGDHDPSGLDMTRDITDRLTTFVHQDWVNEFAEDFTAGPVARGAIRRSMRERMRAQGSTIGDDEMPWEVRRIALTIEQIEEYQPPPNPAKTTDARFQRYQDETGLDESWELDALDPIVMEELIQDEIDAFKDHDAYDKAEAKQERERLVLKAVKDNWEAIKAAHEPKIGRAS